VVVDRSLAEAGRLCNGVHGHGLRTPFEEDSLGGIEDLVGAYLGLTGPATRGGHASDVIQVA
jgi:hypothetical protein